MVGLQLAGWGAAHWAPEPLSNSEFYCPRFSHCGRAKQLRAPFRLIRFMAGSFVAPKLQRQGHRAESQKLLRWFGLGFGFG